MKKRQKQKEIVPDESTDKTEYPFVFSGAENTNDIEGEDIMGNPIEPGVDAGRTVRDDISKRMQKVDAKELAQMVRHSIKEE